MAIPAEAESRREHRQRVLKGASILTGINNSEVACMVRNMNKAGAELRVAMESRVPEEFLLYVPVDGVAYRATLVWRAGERVGVRFVGTEPKPHWHYG